MTDAEAGRYSKQARIGGTPVPGTLLSLLDRAVQPGETVLDVGCGSGDLGALLASRDVIVDGIEGNPARAAVARAKLRRVQCGYVGADFQAEEGLQAAYDAILFIDVVEHIVDPTPALAWARERLTPAGRILAFIPNSAHVSVRLRLARGDWSYEDSGFFDHDHVRFYDLRTVSELPGPAGLVETGRWYTGRFPSWMRGRTRILHKVPTLAATAVLLEWRVR